MVTAIEPVNVHRDASKVGINGAQHDSPINSFSSNTSCKDLQDYRKEGLERGGRQQNKMPLRCVVRD